MGRMGFYIDLQRAPTAECEFAELGTPPVFWVLYAIAGFALSCMGAAAHAVMRDLARLGSELDVALVWAILASVPFYFLVGLKLVSVRKFVRFEGDTLEAGYRVFGHAIYHRVVRKDQIRGIALVNQRRAPNVAPGQHEDRQYYVRGHWRLVVQRASGRDLVLDRHTDEAALEPLRAALLSWLAA